MSSVVDAAAASTFVEIAEWSKKEREKKMRFHFANVDFYDVLRRLREEEEGEEEKISGAF